MYKKLIKPNFGLEISSLNLMASSQNEIQELLSLLAKYALIVFRGQILEDKDLFELSKKLGDGRLEKSARKISHSAVFPEVTYLTNLRDPENTPLGFPGMDTDYWHSDQEFQENPATLGALYCLIPASSGGMTSFAYTGLDTFKYSKGLLNKLRQLRSTRIPAKTHDNVIHQEVSHPLILRNPITDKEFIYISENLVQFEKMSNSDGNSLKSQLLADILVKENIYAHKWKMGDFILYDNTQLVHRREQGEGLRWLKATKIFANKFFFAVPQGKVVVSAVQAASY